MATLETAELRLQLKSDEAKWLGYRKQADAAMREDKRADMQIAQAQADQVAAEMEILKHRIAQAVIVSPMDGYVTSGDLRKQLGAPVKTGDVLFEVANLSDLRAELAVPEDIITDVRAAQQDGRGAHRLAGDDRQARRAHRLRRRADQPRRRGGQGQATSSRSASGCSAGPAGLSTPSCARAWKASARSTSADSSYGYIWTRKMINWVRMKLWI